jgi:hypothetical protein
MKAPMKSEPSNKPQDAQAVLVGIVEAALQFRGDRANLSTIAKLAIRAAPMLRLDATARAAAENGATIEVARRLGPVS